MWLLLGLGIKPDGIEIDELAVKFGLLLCGTTRCVRDGLGGNEWVLLISFPDNIGTPLAVEMSKPEKKHGDTGPR